MSDAPKVSTTGVLRRSFLTGLLVVVPSGLTFWLCWTGFRWIDAGLIYLLRGLPLEPIPGMGFVLGFALVLGLGAFANNFLGRRIVSFYENVLHRVPVVNWLFPALQQIAALVFTEDRTAFEKVVLVEYPRKGMYVLGFWADEAPQMITRTTGHTKLLSIFIPTTPNPTSGFLVLVPEEDVTVLAISPDVGLKLIISGGLLKPEELLEQAMAPGDSSSSDAGGKGKDIPQASESHESSVS